MTNEELRGYLRSLKSTLDTMYRKRHKDGLTIQNMLDSINEMSDIIDIFQRELAGLESQSKKNKTETARIQQLKSDIAENQEILSRDFLKNEDLIEYNSELIKYRAYAQRLGVQPQYDYWGHHVNTSPSYEAAIKSVSGLSQQAQQDQEGITFYDIEDTLDDELRENMFTSMIAEDQAGE
jgi:hypothetical protein